MHKICTKCGFILLYMRLFSHLLGSVSGTDGDLYVTTNELFDQIPEDIQEKTIVLSNFVDKDAIKKSIDPKLENLGK
ncbi:hypothetical protein [Lacticaseibacillus rhamnosus]|uniref:hypothetical protein n=1 Tax=Lacticaseibacillus rhamnosus TaxID=47715 RepID=UPI00237F2A65|nr:hypothetical protein [Lacticaseibacillus rhamnosus]MDE3300976.1 hypothetical protein [Lacticaseibacillus rhamnosus]